MSSLTVVLHSLKEQCEAVGVSPELSLSYAWQLLEAATKKTKSQLLITKEIILLPEQEAWLQQALARLGSCEPLQYILGEVQFLDCAITVCPPFLIPRVETEEWVAKLIAYVHEHFMQPQRILDVGTGSGCIALALAKEFPNAEIIGVDVHPKAIDIARANATLNHIKNVQFMQSDVYDQLPDGMVYNIIVSNPPYVRESDWNGLDSSVQKWEDKHAIVAQDDGLAIIKRIINGSTVRLQSNKNQPVILCIEIDIHQGAIVQQLFLEAGFINVIIMQDMYGRDRVVRGARPHPFDTPAHFQENDGHFHRRQGYGGHGRAPARRSLARSLGAG